MATVLLPGALARLFPGMERRVTLPAATVREAIDMLDAATPGVRARLCDSSPAIRQHIRIFVDGERADLGTELGEGSMVEVSPAISGG